MKKYDYKAASRLDMLDPALRLLHKLNSFAFVSILVSSAVGLTLNYVLRMLSAPGGLYAAYTIGGVACCLVYPYVHEFAHAFAVLVCRGKLPTVKFGKLCASCGSPDIFYTKAQYVFVAIFPFAFYSAALVPLSILLPPMYFPLVFLPLMYNVFGSVADFVMIRLAVKAPRSCLIVDMGTEIVTYAPLDG